MIVLPSDRPSVCIEYMASLGHNSSFYIVIERLLAQIDEQGAQEGFQFLPFLQEETLEALWLSKDQGLFKRLPGLDRARTGCVRQRQEHLDFQLTAETLPGTRLLLPGSK